MSFKVSIVFILLFSLGVIVGVVCRYDTIGTLFKHQEPVLVGESVFVLSHCDTSIITTRGTTSMITTCYYNKKK